MVGFGETRIYRAVYPRAKGQLVLATICRAYWLPRVDYVVEGQMAFIRDSREPMEVVDGFADPQIDATLKAIQHARRHEVPDYWATHRVVFAEVMGVTGPNCAEKRSTILLRLMLTLGGELDPGKTPEVAASAGPKGFGPPRCQQLATRSLPYWSARGLPIVLPTISRRTCRRSPAGSRSNLRRKRLCRPKGRKGDYRASRSGHAAPVTKRQSSDWTGPAPRHPHKRRPRPSLGNRQRSVSRDYKSARSAPATTSFFARWEPSAAPSTLTNSTVACRPATSLGRHWSHVFPRAIGAAAAHGSLQGHRPGTR